MVHSRWYTVDGTHSLFLHTVDGSQSMVHSRWFTVDGTHI